MTRTISILAALGIAIVPACGSDDAATEVELPPAAEEGREVFRSKGCAACHGKDGEGQVGPSLVGIVGTEVEIQGRDPVLVDRDYLVESIVDPGAKLAEGYNLPMPTTQLSDEEIDAVIAYIESVSEVAP